MLEKIREGSQGLVVKIILGLVILSFALAGIGGYLGRTTEQPVAEVNGVVIGQAQFSRAFENERARLEQQFGEYFNQIAADPNYMAQVRKSVVDRLVQDELQVQLAKELGMRVSDEQLKKTIVEMPYFQIGGQFNNDRYLQVIRQMNFQPDSFREFLRTDMTRSQLVQALAGTDFILDNEVQSSLALEQQQRAIDYVVFDKNQVLESVVVSDEEVQDYYALNQAQFQAPEQIAVDYVELQAADIQLATPPSEEDVQAYYDEHKAQYVDTERRRVAHILIESGDDEAAAKAKAEAVLARIKAGEDFAKLAETESSDVVSAENGGDLDWIERDMMDPAFEDAAFSLQAKGDVSDVVQSEFGFHIIKLTDLQAEKVKELAAVRDTIFAELERTARIEAFYQKQTQLAEKAFEISDTLQDAAEVAGVSVKQQALTAKSELPAPLNVPAVSTALATPEVLEDRVNSEVLEVGPEHVVIVRVTDYKAATTKALDEVKDSIVARLKADKASALVKEQAEAMLAKVQQGEVFATAAGEMEVKHEDALTRRAFTVSPAVVREAFKMPHPTDSVKPVQVVELSNGDAAVVQLLAVKQPEQAADANEQQKQSLAMAQANKNYLALLDALKAGAEVKVPQTTVVQE
ncbi:SurA N-terminal domain-containing protein [Pseudoalteromonas fenneropenaei]|uniref:Periplasmic chaperone PpiD n=1 Tax=Pseudoalteromonas fenneropenaei TaxID=1737459 RepID=A0ABV7CNH2_9GAMM